MWNTIRKSMFTISAVIFAPTGVMMQTWAALVLLLFYFAVFLISKPYDKPYLNQLERNALSINVVTLLLGVGLFTNDRSSADSKSETLALFITVVILCLNLCFVLNVVLTLMKHSQYCSWCQSKRVQYKMNVVLTLMKMRSRTLPSSAVTIVPTTLQETENNEQTVVALHLALKKNKKEEAKNRGNTKPNLPDPRSLPGRLSSMHVYSTKNTTMAAAARRSSGLMQMSSRLPPPPPRMGTGKLARMRCTELALVHAQSKHDPELLSRISDMQKKKIAVKNTMMHAEMQKQRHASKLKKRGTQSNHRLKKRLSLREEEARKRKRKGRRKQRHCSV